MTNMKMKKSLAHWLHTTSVLCFQADPFLRVYCKIDWVYTVHASTYSIFYNFFGWIFFAILRFSLILLHTYGPFTLTKIFNVVFGFYTTANIYELINRMLYYNFLGVLNWIKLFVRDMLHICICVHSVSFRTW